MELGSRARPCVRTWAKWEVVAFPSSVPGVSKPKVMGGYEATQGHLMLHKVT